MTIAILTLAIGQASAASSRSSGERRLAAMTPAQFQARTTLHDDDLDTVATITTANGFVDRKPLLRPALDDVFLRAFIDKKTGRTAYQAYVRIRYRDYGWANWDTANYATPAGPRTIATQRIARLKASCPRGFACLRSETVGFAIAAALLSANAKLYAGDGITSLPFKIMAQNGGERAFLLSTAEIAGLLMAVDAYRTDHHLPTS
ncbi:MULTISPECIES: hypothetical protein [unclassified Sphingomonas]|uniref:hypothetical protein n=1 Tax=unclassified Sphingomonas TaxID=196159 RepID=UPI0007139121|nr:MULTISPECIES: hypothetical protein [unclassified Sphingomonas]KQO13214.1 hypothetical protein ASF09_02845 [Sphingomonas sp. Leaf242]